LCGAVNRTPRRVPPPPPEERTVTTYGIEGFVGPREGLHVVEKKRI
jgi:hypothetical protein